MLENETAVGKDELKEIAEVFPTVKKNAGTEYEQYRAYVLGVVRGFELTADLEKLTRSQAPAM